MTEMGGYGSGLRGFVHYGRMTTSECYSIDVNRFNREATLTDGSSFVWQWADGFSLTVAVGDDELRLEYIAEARNGRSERIKETVYIWPTPCHYGGFRPWFECPGCYDRVGKLYLRNGQFKCRKCHNLTYRSCQVTHDPTMEAMERVKRIRQKMGAEGNLIYPNEPVPRRPKGMHRAKYKLLRQQLAKAEDAYESAFLSGVQRVIGRRGGA